MGVGLQPLEFTECLADSPHFRENLQRHEKELDHTSQQIKRLIKEVKDVVQAAKRLGAAQLALANTMDQLEVSCIGASMTEDERVIGRSLHHFANLIRTIEDERERMLGRAHEQIIQPLERFRKEHIGAVKEGKKKFDKKTAKFCQTQERTLALSTKKPETVFQEADAGMEMAERDFCQASLEYVFQLQAVQERRKFELVETLLGFVFGWWTFHHTAHDVHVDAEPAVRDLQLRIQRTRSNFEETSKQTESLMKKMMEVRQMNKEEEGEEGAGTGATRAGYLFLLEKKAFGTTWSKQYCTYESSSRLLTLTPYNQINVKAALCGESVAVSGARICTDGVERRWCWDALLTAADRAPLTLQARSDADRANWIRALTAPHYTHHDRTRHSTTIEGDTGCALDEAGFTFVRRIISELEARGLDEQGLYRIAGVASKVSRLVKCATDGRLPTALDDALEWETRTLTSALKGYLRALPDPLTTRALHHRFIAAAKCESGTDRVSSVHALVHSLPPRNFDMLKMVIGHLCNVAAKSDKNLMTASNLAVCFGPTLLRAERETVASILDIKFYNVVAETLLDHYHSIFDSQQQNTTATGPASTTNIVDSHQHNGVIRTSPVSAPASVITRTDINSCSALVPARYSPHHQQLLYHFATTPAGPTTAPPPPALLALRGVARSSSSSESVSSSSASPPPVGAAVGRRWLRVRTLYACLGESEGELSFEPNQIITNVSASAEPGWLRGTLNGKTGLVPANYVEPLP